MLLLTLIPVVLLSQFLAVIVDFGIEDLDLPDALGGVLIAILVLAPEGLTAFHAALVPIVFVIAFRIAWRTWKMIQGTSATTETATT